MSAKDPWKPVYYVKRFCSRRHDLTDPANVGHTYTVTAVGKKIKRRYCKPCHNRRRRRYRSGGSDDLVSVKASIKHLTAEIERWQS